MSVGHSKARLGTQVSSMTEELREFFGAPRDAGLLIQHIEPGSAAEVAKLAVGDVLTQVDGQRVEHVSDVRDALSDRNKGDVVEVVIIRKKTRKTLKVTLTGDAGPTAFTIPAMPSFELPPEAQRFMGPEGQRELERALDQARDQLRAMEHDLQRIEVPGAAPPPPTPPTPATPPAAPKAKRGRPGKR